MKRLKRLINSSQILEHKNKPFFSLLVVVVRYKAKRFGKRWLWFLLRPFIKKVSKLTSYLSPITSIDKPVNFLICDPSELKEVPKSKDQTSALRKKIEAISSLGYREVFNFQSLSDKKNSLFVISHEYNLNVLRRTNLFALLWTIFLLRRNKVLVWIFPADAASLDYLIRNALIVALCGGSIVCETNTTEQMKKFGVPHPFGPYIWTQEFPLLKSDFYLSPRQSNKKNLCLLAGSGGGVTRNAFMNNLENYFQTFKNLDCVRSNQSLTWEEYTTLVKSSLVIATTSKLQESHCKGMWMFGDSLPETTLTNRVLEGFAACAAVITTKDECLKFMGFSPGVDYIEILNIHNFTAELNNYQLSDFKKIGINGHRRLVEFLTSQEVASKDSFDFT